MSKKHSEERLEDAIEYQLLENDGFQKGDSKNYDTERALEPARIIGFIRQTQHKLWHRKPDSEHCSL